MRTAERWSREDDLELILSYAFGDQPARIAQRLGRTRKAAVGRVAMIRRAFSLGEDYSVDETVRDARMRVKVAAYEASKPDYVATRDDEYVRLVARAGGFLAFSERRGPRGHCAVCLPLIAPDLRGIAA